MQRWWTVPFLRDMLTSACRSLCKSLCDGTRRFEVAFSGIRVRLHPAPDLSVGRGRLIQPWRNDPEWLDGVAITRSDDYAE